MSSDGPTKPVVEAPHGPEKDETSQRALRLRIRQQELLAKLGVTALKGTALSDLLNEAVGLAAEGLKAEFCKVLEYIPAENRLLMRAGVGWHEGLVGTVSVGADLASPSGFALHTGQPVISNHLESEERFRTPDLLAAHGVRRAINVILQGDGAPYGVLEVDSRSEGEFSEHDLAFLQGAANVLGMAIERQRKEQALTESLERQMILLKEINHRVKNSLQLVASMLTLQTGNDVKLDQRLQEASSRILAIARAHERLYRSAQVERIEISDYLRDVCEDLKQVVPNCDLLFEASGQFSLVTDQAINLALVVTELITNAAKHGYPNGTRGTIWVGLGRADGGAARVSVRDEGLGLPPDHEVTTSRGFGTRLIRALVKQMQGQLRTEPRPRGTEFVLQIPGSDISAGRP
jgi:two-component sensor histidine kinase